MPELRLCVHTRPRPTPLPPAAATTIECNPSIHAFLLRSGHACFEAASEYEAGPGSVCVTALREVATALARKRVSGVCGWGGGLLLLVALVH